MSDKIVRKKREFAVGKVKGSSPAEDLYYVLVLFDIADSKKYRLLVKLLKRYSTRIQKSAFEAYLRTSQVKELVKEMDKLMESERYYNEDDNVRIYRIAGNCNVTVFGRVADNVPENNIFF